MDKALRSLLKDPAAEYRAKPFWAWNGKLDVREAQRQIEVFRDMGFGGFFIHSRSGLETEYLGEEWFACTEACIRKAEELGMEVWLYDEDRWPSGTCGGLISADVKNRLRFISLYESDREALECPEVVGILKRYAVKTEMSDGETFLVDFFPVGGETEVPQGYEYAVFAEEVQKNEEFFNGFTYIDTMNREVTEEFLRSTHEKYFLWLGKYFGNTVKGFFTDEPFRGPLFNGANIENANKNKMAPFTAALPHSFSEKYGIPFDYPLLYWKRLGESENVFAAEYVQTIQDLFLENFARPYYDWCDSHGLKVTGHIKHEDNLCMQTSMLGACMPYYEYLHYPGIDILTRSYEKGPIVKQAVSVATQLGCPFVLSEMYGATGWNLSLNEYKSIGDWQAVLGVNLRCPHLSWYSMKGYRKRDYPACISSRLAFYREWKYLEDYFSRLSVITANGKRVCRTLVIHPVKNMWKKVSLGWLNGFDLQRESAKAEERNFLNDYRKILLKGIDFDYGDDDLIEKYGSIVERDGRIYLCVGKAEYSEIIWDGSCGEKSKRLLAEFVALGGKCVKNIDELSEADAVKTPSEIVRCVYALEEEYWVFLLNGTGKHVDGEVEFPAYLDGYNIERWDFIKGFPIGRVETNGRKAAFGFAENENVVLRFTKEKAAKKLPEEYSELQIGGEYNYELTEYNVLPLDEGICWKNGEILYGGRKKDILLFDLDLRLWAGMSPRGNYMIQPWYLQKYKKEYAERALGEIRMEFGFCSEVEIPVYIAVEKGRFQYFFNGEKLTRKSDKFWIDECFCLYPVQLTRGKNTVVLVGNMKYGDELEAVYVLGDFGVYLPSFIKALPQKLKTGNIADQGLPHYTGSIKYFSGITRGNYRISLKKFKCALMKIEGTKEETLIAFPPYTATAEVVNELVFEVFFPRRNTFGPLHRVSGKGWFGPGNFIVEDGNRAEFTATEQGLYD